MIEFWLSGFFLFFKSLLKQIEEYYSAQGLGIVGYFHANERFDDGELLNLAKNIADHIYRYFPRAAILLVCTVDLMFLMLFFLVFPSGLRFIYLFLWVLSNPSVVRQQKDWSITKGERQKPRYAG